MMATIVVNPQWQGGADPITQAGALELQELYLEAVDYELSPVEASDENPLPKAHGIVGFDVLKRQMAQTSDLLQRLSPDKVLAIGGGCDADVPVIAYLDQRLGGDLAVVWLDAHGDLNSPEESSTALFYGMPLRSLMDGSCFGLLDNPLPLTSDRIIHVGARDLDVAELAFIESSGITRFTVADVRANASAVAQAVRSTGCGNVYVHLDLDVLDPSDFPNTPLPVEGGILADELMDVLESLAPDLVGIGLYEYAPAGKRVPLIEHILEFGKSL